MNRYAHIPYLFTVAMLTSTCHETLPLAVEVFETSAAGHRLTRLNGLPEAANQGEIGLLPEESYQVISGFGGSFTEAAAHVMNLLSSAKRKEIIEAYFGESGARYSLTRTPIGSCDFSLGHYSYAPVEHDHKLEHFTIDHDRETIISLILDAMAISKDGFRIIASPWTAPPWMKDNQDWKGGKLLPEYYDTWALYFAKYIAAYRETGIDIWGLTVENEPLGNDRNWESMHFGPQEMNVFVAKHLGPKLEAAGHRVKILGYDQNRDEELIRWVDAMYNDKAARAYYGGTALHWYASTYNYFPEALQYAHQKAPDQHLIQTEACVDAQVPRWRDDAWYWSEEATDWGWDWAPADKKHLHPKYTPVFRYARDIIGCLNNWVDGWIDWNMVLDRQGGPNWAKNWCVAPVIADPEKDEVYYTPLYYIMVHFSRFIRPGAVRIGFRHTDNTMMVTAAQNPDGGIALILFNPGPKLKSGKIKLADRVARFAIQGKALQTIMIAPN